MKNIKIVLVGCGSVGTSFVYSAINQGLAQEYVLIDVNNNAAEGNSLDFNDCNAIVDKPFVNVKAGTYKDCNDANVIVIAAGRSQKLGETRMDMVIDNAKIMKSIALEIKKSGFSGITIIASNPVDVLTTIYQNVTEYDYHRVLGSGTILDSSRLRRLIAVKLDVHPLSVQANIMGEHGDSSMVPWSCATVGGKKISDLITEGVLTQKELFDYQKQAIYMAYKIIEKKKATFYGIGIVLAAITKAVVRGENIVMLIGAYLNGEYGHKGIYTGVPAVINNNGWSRIITLNITKDEQIQFDKSCNKIYEALKISLKAIN